MPYSHNSLATRLIAAALIASTLLMLNGCAELQRSSEVKRLGAPIEGYNHLSSSAINRFSVNGSGGSNVGSSSGGGQTCCVVLPVTWQPGLTVVVEWEEDPDPFAYGDWPEKAFTDAWRERMDEHETHYTQHRVEVEVAPYEALGVVNVHFLPCNEIKVSAGTTRFGLASHPYNYPLNMEEPDQCPASPKD
ncbi:DUF3304 domain-containing protein [Pseudomonas neustonica]|uniref:DUF3304 domain-containing protein n=1 Tax=Pseudomonas neustonica TaxID=2487346 RepID=UPI003F4772EF